MLAANRVRATFFLIGQQAERHPELVQQIVRSGHVLGNHSWTHPQFDRLGLAEQRAEIERMDRFLQRFDGIARHDFRPPRGVMPRPMVLDCIRSGRRLAYWSYDTLDYSQRPAEELIASARRIRRSGEILLMHATARCRCVCRRCCRMWPTGHSSRAAGMSAPNAQTRIRGYEMNGYRTPGRHERRSSSRCADW